MSISSSLSDLIAATAGNGDLIYIVQGGNSRKVALGAVGAQLLADTGYTGALTSIGVTALGRNLLDDTGQTKMLTTLGGGAKGRAIFQDTGDTAVLTELGFSALMRSLRDDTGQTTALTTLGAVKKTGDTMTGPLVITDTTNTAATGEWFIGGKSRTATGPLTDDIIVELSARSIDPANGGSIRTRSLIEAVATENHAHATSNGGYKVRQRFVPAGSASHVIGSELNETGFKVKMLGTNLEHLATMPRMWGAEGDTGATLDTGAFSDLEAQVSDRDIDLGGRIYRVTTIPTGNKYRNGFWKVGNYYYPADSLIKRQYMVTAGTQYETWPQDQAHNYRGERFCGYGSGTDHNIADNVAKVARIGSKGYATPTYETVSSDTGNAVWCAAMGKLWGRQFAAIRRYDDTGGHVVDYQLYSRRLAERKQLSTPFTTTSGSNVVTVTWPINHGLRTGDQVVITSAAEDVGGTVNGVTLSGTYNVTRTGHTTFTVVGTNNATSSGAGGDTDVNIEILENAWAVVAMSGGGTLGAAIQTKTGAAGIPEAIQSFGPYFNDRAFLCVSGNGQFGVIRLDGLFGSPTVGAYTAFVNTSSRTEATLGIDNDTGTVTTDGFVYGLMRPTAIGTATVFWWASATTGATVTVTESVFSYAFGVGNPMPIRYHDDTDTLYAVAMDRTLDASGTPKDNQIYLLVANATSARTNGASAFKVITPDDMKVHGAANGYFGSSPLFTASESGVPSLDIDGDTLIIYHGEGDGRRQSSGVTIANVKAIELDISSPIIS